MEREEPTLGAPDLTDVRIRSDRRPMPQERASEWPNLWWQIALGVFLGALAHSIVVGLYVRYEAQQAVRELEKETKKAIRQLGATAPTLPYPQEVDAPTYTAPARYYRPLAGNERCMNGARIRRVGDAWVDVPNDPCR